MLRLKEIKAEELKALGFEDCGYVWAFAYKSADVADAEVYMTIDKESGIIDLETSGDEELYSDAPAVSASVTNHALDVLYDLIASGRGEKVTDAGLPT